MNKRVLFIFLLPVILAVFSTPSVVGADLSWFAGRPAFSEGSDRGYFIWREGDTWHVRWTTKGQLLRFSGSVTAEGGELKSLKRIDVEEERRLIAPGRPARVVVGPRGRARVKPGTGPVVATREQDKIEKDGDRRIMWVARTDADIDGFNFKTDSKVTSLRFNLEIEGKSEAAFVYAGAARHQMNANPFRVDLK